MANRTTKKTAIKQPTGSKKPSAKTYKFTVRPYTGGGLDSVKSKMLFYSAKEFPDNLREAMLNRDERTPYGGFDRKSGSSVSNNDYFTPLSKGKEWLLELTLKYQPKTGKLLMEGGPMVLFGYQSSDTVPKYGINNLIQFNLAIEAQGNMVFFNRMNVGHNPSDEGWIVMEERDRKRLISQGRPGSIVNRDTPLCAPFELSQAYFQRFWGMASLGIDLMPFGCNGTELVAYLGKNRLVKKYSDVLNERFKNIDLAEQKKPIDALSVLSDSFGMWSSQCDLLFLESYREHSPIYYVRNREFENIRILDNYVEGLDNYYYYLLTGGRQDGPFDFMPYTKPFKGR